VNLSRQLDRLGAVVTRAAAAFDARRDWEADGARSAAAWMAVRCHMPVTTARRRVGVGRELRVMAAAEAAWLRGEVNEVQVEALVAARRRVGGARFDPDEAELVGHARRLRHHHFLRALAYWRQGVDSDGAEQNAAEQCGARRFHPVAELRRDVVL
jgi:hypothetical protein